LDWTTVLTSYSDGTFTHIPIVTVVTFQLVVGPITHFTTLVPVPTVTQFTPFTLHIWLDYSCAQFG